MTDPVMLLSRSHGEDRVTFRALKESGYTTIEKIAGETARALADHAGLSLQTARRLRTGAKDMLARNPRGSATRPAVGPPAAPRARDSIEPSPSAGVFSEGITVHEASLLVQDTGTRKSRPTPPAIVSDPALRREPAPSANPRSTFWSFG